jgi:phosphoribosyl-ATP pyrophosphohydrolase
MAVNGPNLALKASRGQYENVNRDASASHAPQSTFHNRLILPSAPLVGKVRLVSDEHVFDRLMAVIRDRKARPPEKSYTATLLAGGIEKIGQKVIEEAGEAAAAARDDDGANLVHEAADLVYHLFVLLASRDVPLADVEAELARRLGTSGLAEKASRAKLPRE